MLVVGSHLLTGSKECYLQPHAGRLLPAATVNIYGLTRPVSFAWDDSNPAQTLVLVAEKAGIIKVNRGWSGQPSSILIDLSAKIASWGDHGFTGLILHGGYMWVTYMVAKAPWGSTGCTDHGQMDGRELINVEGCPISGRVSRFPYANGQLTGPEEVVVEGANHGYCCQFSTHSVASPVFNDVDSKIYVEWGDGAAFALVDAGELGHNPCNDTAPYLGE